MPHRDNVEIGYSALEHVVVPNGKNPNTGIKWRSDWVVKALSVTACAVGITSMVVAAYKAGKVMGWMSGAAAGATAGASAGYEMGVTVGRVEAFDVGFNQGYASGVTTSYTRGFDAGFDAGVIAPSALTALAAV